MRRNDPTSVCSRRDLLRLGALAPLGLGLAGTKADLACVVVWLSGGLSHLDTFDLKPRAPSEYRGEFREIPTKVPGIRICERLPRIARTMDKITIVRSMRSRENNHERATNLLLGARAWPEPLLRNAARAAPEPWKQLDRYGQTRLGAACLRARREIENGARLAVATSGRLRYDTHADSFRRLKQELLPEFDRAFAALIQDLDDRRMLETTLVVAMSEFGRSPRLNASGGRDHHSNAWSILLAGGGLPGGHIIGATDKTGAEVVDDPWEPEDLLERISRLSGVERERRFA